MDQILAFVNQLLAYLKEFKAADIVNMIKDLLAKLNISIG